MFPIEVKPRSRVVRVEGETIPIATVARSHVSSFLCCLLRASLGPLQQRTPGPPSPDIMSAHSVLMPSEVARLVLGYLKQSGCREAYGAFLNESKHLVEYKEGLRMGIEYPTEIGAKSLMQHLNDRPKVETSGSTPQIASGSSQNMSELSEKMDTILRQLHRNNSDQMVIIPPSPAGQTQASSSVVATSESQDMFKTPVKQYRKSLGRVFGSSSSPGVKGTTGGEATPGGSRTPRKSATPRKMNVTSMTLSETTSSSVAGDSTLTPRKGGAHLHIDPNVVVGELIKNPVVPDLLAETVNRILYDSGNSESVIPNLTSGPLPDLSTLVPTSSTTSNLHIPEATDEKSKIDWEKKMADEIMNLFDKNPEFSQFVDEISAKAINDYEFDDGTSSFASTPITPGNDLSEGDSLTTPKAYLRETAIERRGTPCSANRSSGYPVKNLMNDLKTPEKRQDSSPFTSSPFVAASSPYTDPMTESPVKILDFNALTASPIQQPMITLTPRPIIIQTLPVPSPFKIIQHHVSQQSIHPVLNKLPKILPKPEKSKSDGNVSRNVTPAYSHHQQKPSKSTVQKFSAKIVNEAARKIVPNALKKVTLLRPVAKRKTPPSESNHRKFIKLGTGDDNTTQRLVIDEGKIIKSPVVTTDDRMKIVPKSCVANNKKSGQLNMIIDEKAIDLLNALPKNDKKLDHLLRTKVHNNHNSSSRSSATSSR